jgi:5'(3')-deoxyribonucleotidase
MKFFEYQNTFTAKPEVYIDMDNTLCDFFGPVAKHHAVNNWRDARKQRKAGGGKIDKLAKKPGYFLNLKPLPNAGKLISGVMKLRGEYNILSSPLLSAVEQSSREKSQWLQKHLKRNAPRAVLFDHEKFKFARQADGTPNILIDDYDTNIHLWEANGGIGILYKDDECDRVLKQLHHALLGKFHRTYREPLAILQKEIEQQNEDEEEDNSIDLDKKYYTNKEILNYIKGIHDEYHLDEPVMDHKIWVLRMVPLHNLSSPEKYDQDDRYCRVIDLDWDHISKITRKDVAQKPCVADEQGWVLDGNHRVTAARAANLKRIPCFIPLNK